MVLPQKRGKQGNEQGGGQQHQNQGDLVAPDAVAFGFVILFRAKAPADHRHGQVRRGHSRGVPHTDHGIGNGVGRQCCGAERDHVHFGHHISEGRAHLFQPQRNADLQGGAENPFIAGEYLPEGHFYRRFPEKQQDHGRGGANEPRQQQGKNAAENIHPKHIQKQNAEHQIGGVDDDAQGKAPAGFSQPTENAEVCGIYGKHQNRPSSAGKINPGFFQNDGFCLREKQDQHLTGKHQQGQAHHGADCHRQPQRHARGLADTTRVFHTAALGDHHRAAGADTVENAGDHPRQRRHQRHRRDAGFAVAADEGGDEHTDEHDGQTVQNVGKGQLENFPPRKHRTGQGTCEKVVKEFGYRMLFHEEMASAGFFVQSIA